MNVYKLLELWILIAAFFSYKLYIKSYPNNFYKDKSKKRGFIITTFLPIVIITGFRGDLWMDYSAYQYNYENVIQSKSISQLLIKKEPGFAILQKIIGTLSDYNIVWLMTVLAIITCTAYYRFFYRYSDLVWLSIFMLLVIGNYYTCFDTTRQYMATAIFSLCTTFIINRQFFKYFISVLLISTIHTSALVMLPFYFLLDVDWTSKRKCIIKGILALLLIIICLFSSAFLDIVMKFFYVQYADSSLVGTGMVLPKQLIKVVFIVFMIIINRDIIDFTNPLDRICVNSVIYLFIFSFISLENYILYRFKYYMLPFSLVLLANIISRRNNAKKRLFMQLILGGFLLLFILGTQNELPYKWFWQ